MLRGCWGKKGLIRHGTKRPRKSARLTPPVRGGTRGGRKLAETRAGGLLLVANFELRTCVHFLPWARREQNPVQVEGWWRGWLVGGT